MKKLSEESWQPIIMEALVRLASCLPQFAINTCADGANLTIRFGLRLTGEDGETDCTHLDHLTDPQFTGCIRIQYWQWYKDFLDCVRQEREMQGVSLPKAAQDLEDETYGPNGPFAFQLEWPLLNISGGGTGPDLGIFLKRSSKKKLQRCIQEAFLEEAYAEGFVIKAEDEDQFFTLNGASIVLK